MHKFAALGTAAALSLAAVAVEAAPVQYVFHARLSREQNADYSPVPQYLFADGAVVSGTFRYDSSAAAVVTNIQGSGELASFGPYSIYGGSILQLTGQADGHAFSAATGSTLVADASTWGLDGVFNIAGNLNGDDLGSGFQGFSVYGLTLKSFNFYNAGGALFLPDQSLPFDLAEGLYGSGVRLTFEDAEHRERIVTFGPTTYFTVAPVPVPAAGWMFGAALLGLTRIARKK